MRDRSAMLSPIVKPTKIGMAPKGLITENSAAKM
jgi:hypothetical protein